MNNGLHMNRSLLSALAVLALAGCASSTRTPNYECPLESFERAKCASVTETYNATRTQAAGAGVKTQSVFDPAFQQGARAAAAGGVALSNYPEPGNTGMPVFQQPKVMRVWVGPYVDADGNLRSGEYTYFSTPGQWNYGTLKKPGAASGIFEPTKPNNLGFKPVIPPAPATQQAKPARPPEPPSTSQGAAAGSTPAPSTSSTGITQPYQRLGN